MNGQPSTNTQAPNGASDTWDETRLEEAMERLTQLHVKVQ